MENMQYAEELVREFLVFRGFTNTLQALDNELSTDIGKEFQVDKLIDLIFAIYIPRFQVDKLVGLLNFFKQCFSNLSENVLVDTLLKLEGYILRYYIVYAIQLGRKDMVLEFFGINGNELAQKGHDWTPWFGRFCWFLLFLWLSLVFWIPGLFNLLIRGMCCSYSLFEES